MLVVVFSQEIDECGGGDPEKLGGNGIFFLQGLTALPKLCKCQLHHLFCDVFGSCFVQNEEIKFLMVLVKYLFEVELIAIL